jgi:hypothetical protein
MSFPPIDLADLLGVHPQHRRKAAAISLGTYSAAPESPAPEVEAPTRRLT